MFRPSVGHSERRKGSRATKGSFLAVFRTAGAGVASSRGRTPRQAGHQKGVACRALRGAGVEWAWDPRLVAARGQWLRNRASGGRIPAGAAQPPTGGRGRHARDRRGRGGDATKGAALHANERQNRVMPRLLGACRRLTSVLPGDRAPQRRATGFAFGRDFPWATARPVLVQGPPASFAAFGGARRAVAALPLALGPFAFVALAFFGRAVACAGVAVAAVSSITSGSDEGVGCPAGAAPATPPVKKSAPVSATTANRVMTRACMGLDEAIGAPARPFCHFRMLRSTPSCAPGSARSPDRRQRGNFPARP